MCTALEELKREGIERGIEQGIRQGIEKGKILARYEDGMTPEEIARRMDLPLQKVKDVLAENKCL